MYRPKQRTIKRLPQLERLPSIDDVMFAMQQARGSRGITFELVWTMSDGQTFYPKSRPGHTKLVMSRLF
jgi:hypothetical protein